MGRKPKKVVEFRVYDLPIHFPVLALDGEQWQISDILSDRLHFHNCLEIGICHSDSGILVFEDETISFRAGDVTCIPRHMLHTTCSSKGERSHWSYLFVDLDEMLYDMMPKKAPTKEAAAPSQLQSYLLLDKQQHPRIHFLVMAILEELRAQQDHHESIVKSMFHVLYHDLLRLEAKNGQSPNDERKNSFALQPALEYIHQHYAQNITIEALAEMCHLSETHFRRRFVSIMGTSPLSFLNATRISQACVLLITTDQPVLAIAEEVGFPSISCFNRSFQQLLGVSPKEYRTPSVYAKINPQRRSVLQYKGWMMPDKQPEFVNKDDGKRQAPTPPDTQPQSGGF